MKLKCYVSVAFSVDFVSLESWFELKKNANMVIEYLGKSQRNLEDEIIS